MKKFKIKSGKWWFWVYVYDKIERLRKDAIKFEYRKMTNIDKETMAICQPYTRLVLEKGKKDRLHENLGIIRLNRRNATTSVVAHEVIHAAFWQYRIEYGKNGKPCRAYFMDKVNNDEEVFAHIYDQLFADMTRKLYKFKVWS